MRAYTGLVERGEPELVAREAAAIVFRWHHPSMQAAEREHIVTAWLDRRRLH
ncbi:hypothetical protein [Inquilinus sp. CAU 1745]|uniref:hypothetical protein n=1 Tax=Inquilinus sp. CAU 1745 TaxID=3140369 RepID=UPI00325B417E